MPDGIEKMRIPRRSGFCGAAEIQLASNRGDLGSYRGGEELSKELRKRPLCVDICGGQEIF